MISQEKSYILATLQKLPKNVRDLGKLIVAKGFKKLPKVQKIAQSGHTGSDTDGKGKRNRTMVDRHWIEKKEMINALLPSIVFTTNL